MRSKMVELLRQAPIVAICMFLFMTSCEPQPDAKLVKALKQDWITTNVLGEKETVRFGNNEIMWQFGSEKQFACEYRVITFQEADLEMCLRIWCEERTGTASGIDHRIVFEENLEKFTMTHGADFGNADGVFTLKK